MKKSTIFTNITNKKESTKKIKQSIKKTKKENSQSELIIEFNNSLFILCHKCITKNKINYSFYTKEIFNHFLTQENKNNPLPNYIIHQSEIEWPMRTALVAWIVEIHKKLALTYETFFHCVNLIDRFLSLRSVKPESLQLIGLTSLMISCKYEEVVCLSLDTFNNISKKISGKEILLAEGYILHSLKSNVEFVNPMSFLRLFCHCKCKNDLLFKISHFILIRLFLDELFIKYCSSVKAITAYFLGTKILNEPFTLILTDKIKNCISECVDLMKSPVVHRGINQFCEESEVYDVVRKYFMD